MNSTAGKRGNSGRKCGSPLLRWSSKRNYSTAHAAGKGNGSPVNFRQGSPKTELSARKLAAGLWKLHFLEVSRDCIASFPGSFHFSHSELKSSTACLKFLKEGVKVTKQDPNLSEASNVLAKIRSKKVLRERKLTGGDSVVSALLAELLRAQSCISKLKVEYKSSKKKVEQLVKNLLEEEKVLWKQRKFRDIKAMLDDLEDKLTRERRSRERMEFLNTKLVHELAKANRCANEFRTSYAEERKERELLEEVCNELAMKIGEDKAKLEELERDSMRIREEVEEERKMFEMADLWREESIQMKLVDARLALEDKYNQMNHLIVYLRTFFLRSRCDDDGELDIMELIKQAAGSVLNIQHFSDELSYDDFSKSDADILGIYEELLRKGLLRERVNESESPPNFNGLPSTISIVSLDEDG